MCILIHRLYGNKTKKHYLLQKEGPVHKLRVGVLMGGMSIEKEVSFNSGRTVCDHLDTARYLIIPLFQRADGALFVLPWHFLHRGKISDFEHRLEKEAESLQWDDLKERIDFMYIATHGRYAEDGTLQGMLEVLGIPYLGSNVFASALRMDKAIHKKMLAHAGINIPRGIVIAVSEIQSLSENLALLEERLITAHINYPLIIKPHHEGSSLGVFVVTKQNQLVHALRQASLINPRKPQAILIEEKIQGMEFTCIILTDYKAGKLIPLPPTEMVPPERVQFFDYEQKYMPGKATEFTPARCSLAQQKLIQETCMQVMQIMDMKTMARIDGFLTPEKQVVIIDPNTLSGMAPTSFLFRAGSQLNMNHTMVINHLIETELHNYGMLAALEAEEKKEATAMNIRKIRIAILMGGSSNEKEISLESGRNITYKLSPHTYEAIPIFVTDTMELFQINNELLVRNSTREIQELVDQKTKLKWHDLATIADFVFIALHGGEGENGAVQGALEMLGLPYNGSAVLASALCMDKYKTNQFLAQHGFDIPQALFISQNEWQKSSKAIIEKISNTLPLPLIIKPHDDGCSVMVQKIKKSEHISAALNTLFDAGKSYALVEECISGMELTVGVIGNEQPRALPPSQAVSTGDILSIEEKFLPGAGENQTPAPLPSPALNFVQKTMEQAYKAIGCRGYARIDCFYQDATQSPTGKERVIFIEINTLPGMTPATCIFHQAAEVGIKPMDFIDLIIKLGFEEHGRKIIKDKDLIEVSTL